MGSTSGSSSGVIWLPEGGGALHGIGEIFSPDLHTGTGNFTIPIALPPGRNSLQPQLNLVYSTGNGNGLFGLGWKLSVPGVSHKTSKGVPRYDDTRDVFILSGAGHQRHRLTSNRSRGRRSEESPCWGGHGGCGRRDSSLRAGWAWQRGVQGARSAQNDNTGCRCWYLKGMAIRTALSSWRNQAGARRQPADGQK